MYKNEYNNFSNNLQHLENLFNKIKSQNRENKKRNQDHKRSTKFNSHCPSSRKWISTLSHSIRNKVGAIVKGRE